MFLTYLFAQIMLYQLNDMSSFERRSVNNKTTCPND